MRSRFIVVEDEIKLGGLIKRCLDEFADTTLVHAAPEAIAMVNERPPQLGLLWADLNLPGGRGYDVIAAARKWYDGAIFVVSGYGTSANVFRAAMESALFLPKDVALEKPVRWEVIRGFVIDKASFLFDEAHWAVAKVLDELGLTAADREVALAAANAIDPVTIRRSLNLSDDAWKSRVHRLLLKLGMQGKSLKEAGAMIRHRILERMRVPILDR